MTEVPQYPPDVEPEEQPPPETTQPEGAPEDDPGTYTSKPEDDQPE